MKSAAEILEKAISRGGVWTLVSSVRRFKKWHGKPGEVIEGMEPADREVLQTLKSDDVSESRLGKLVAWLGYDDRDDRGERFFRELKIKFDKLIRKN